MCGSSGRWTGSPWAEGDAAFRRRRGPVGKQVALRLLDPVLHLAPGAVEVLIERPPTPPVGLERGYQKAWVRLAPRPFRFGDHASTTRPALLGRPEKVPEHTRGLARHLGARLGLLEGSRDTGLKPGVESQAEDEVDPVLLAPDHQCLASKARVGPQHDLHPRPARPDLTDDALDLLHRPGARIDVGAAQLGGQEMPAAEDVERQVAVAVVVAMKKAALLAPVGRIVGRVQIEHNL